MDDKVYMLIAGVNGAGKSTFYKSDFAFFELFSSDAAQIFEELKYINSDDILKSIGDWKNTKDMIRAGKEAVKQIKDCFNNGYSFCQETTLCGNSIFNNVKFAKSLGYKVFVVYLGLDSVLIAKERVHMRVKKGGHGIPETDIERRYVQSLSNLNKIYYSCDGIAYFDNSTELNLLATYNEKQLELIADQKTLPLWFKEHLKAVDFVSWEKQNTKGINQENKRGYEL